MKKNRLIYLLILSTFLLNACTDDFLDTKSPSIQSSQNVFENEGMVRSAIMGVYSQLSTTLVYGQKMSVNWQGVSDIELASGYPSQTNTDKTSDTGAANYWCDWYNQTVRWNEIFKLTELASAAVDGIRNSEMLKSNPDKMKPYLGEALVLRSLGYFELVRRWGDIPYKDGMSSSDLSNVYLGKSDRDSVYTAIIKNMQEAIEYLPWLGENADFNCERVTKGFAKGLLARIALFAGGWSLRDGNNFSDANVEHYPNTENNPGMAEVNGYYIGRPKNWRDFYEIAEQQCAEMIGSAENPHRLDPDYGNIWKTVCGLGYNSSNENLFEVANGVGYSGDIGTLMGRGIDGGLGYGSRGFGGTYVSTNAYYFYSFNPDDLRRDYACYWPNYGKTNNVNMESMKNDIMSVRLGKWDFFWTSNAYKSIALTATARVPTGINWIIMRYPDVYLMFAEARNALSDPESVNPVAGMSARQALVKVRERAFGTGSASAANINPDFFQAIVNERAWEFGGEGIRKLDLVRWGLLDQKIEEMKEAMLLLMDGGHPVKIFDKVYQPSDFPQNLYFRYDSNNEFIDLSSVNFYRNLAANPNESLYTTVKWFPANYWNLTEGSETTLVNNSVKVLICASGLRSSYNYSTLFSKLKYGAKISEAYANYNTGNKTCNYRHLYAIYYEDIYESNGYLSNSYGFDYE
ncbi:RagB/SusD family nutrient uptake outer membrane protein [Dysgonomonas termitidis]|uniref:RagB/SusD family nutrient uptake outer membrane protein n=1 Tax=Dysgonomonas termitidis TaxID=1516126 RepID=A0ABV9KS13_9BACT